MAKLAPWVMGLSIAYAAASVVSVLSAFLSPTTSAVVGFLVTPVNLAAIVMAVVWTFMVRKNADLIVGDSGPWGPVWGIFGWIVPLANLVIPYLVLSETWRRTKRAAKPPAWFLTWWLLWVGAQLLGLANGMRAAVLGIQEALRELSRGPDAPPPTAAPIADDPVTMVLMVLTAIVLLFALPFWLRVVREISDRQNSLRRAPAAQPTPDAAH